MLCVICYVICSFVAAHFRSQETLLKAGWVFIFRFPRKSCSLRNVGLAMNQSCEEQVAIGSVVCDDRDDPRQVIDGPICYFSFCNIRTTWYRQHITIYNTHHNTPRLQTVRAFYQQKNTYPSFLSLSLKWCIITVHAAVGWSSNVGAVSEDTYKLQGGHSQRSMKVSVLRTSPRYHFCTGQASMHFQLGCCHLILLSRWGFACLTLGESYTTSGAKGE